MEGFQRGFFELLTMIVFVSIVAVIVSQRANTAAVLQAFGSMMSTLMGAAVSPVTSGGK